MNIYFKLNQDIRTKKKFVNLNTTVYTDKKFQLTQKAFDTVIKALSERLMEVTIIIEKEDLTI